jgi:VWFA-related protein
MIAFMRTAAMAIVLWFAQQFGETITVSRVLVDVRVTNDRGEPVTGLTRNDFIVKIDKAQVRVESATFMNEFAVGDWQLAADAPETSTANHQLPTANSPRLFVVFVQTDFARNSSRVSGQMHFNAYAEKFVEALQPEDRVAVFSFDSHLKFRLDFTSDKEIVAETIRKSLFIDEPPPPPIVHSPALASRLDRDAMKRVTSSEAALLLVGNALMPIDGPKNLLLLGWGLGERRGNVVAMRREWTAARRALDHARVTVFALDTSFADYHDLEFGLQAAARETGGFYAKTHVFPEIAIERLERTLRGRYELELRLPDGTKPGQHDLSIRLKRRGATILAPSSVFVK